MSATTTLEFSPDNPLWNFSGIPRFDQIRAEHVVPAVRQLLKESQVKFSDLEANHEISWDGLMGRLEEMDRPWDYVWSVPSHLNSVRNTPELREAIQAVQGEVVEFFLRRQQSKPIFEAIEKLRSGPAWETLTSARKQAVENALRDARMAGVGLPDEARSKFNRLAAEQSQLSTDFSNKVLDATKAFSLTITNPEDTTGWPTSLKGLAAQGHQRSLPEGTPAVDPEKGPWRITLDFPVYGPFMRFSRKREQRQEVYRAMVSLASHGEFDTNPLLEKILRIRKEMAAMLGFSTYAEMSLSVKMAGTVDAVEQMVRDLETPARKKATTDLQELRELAAQEGQAEPLAHWDIAFWAERLREKRYAYESEQLRPYFPLPKVLDGLFSLAERLFGVVIRPADGQAPVWHPDVRYFTVSDEGDKPLASFFIDPYSRPEDKRGGAWMNECFGRCVIDGQVRRPVIYLVCNSTPPVGDRPSLMTFGEVNTLFHEFGHGLQGMLTTVDDSFVSGMNGVEWDAVELASQFMENWLFHKPTITRLSSHIDTGAPLPDDLFDKVLASKNYRIGSTVMRMLEFSTIDLELHHHFDPDAEISPHELYRKVSERFSVFPLYTEDRFLCSFRHIFAGGYAAGYYSYQWAEILSADAFAAFEEAGLDNPEALRAVGKKYRDTILALGGSKPALEVFRAFRGRDPSPAAFLRQAGLTTDADG